MDPWGDLSTVPGFLEIECQSGVDALINETGGPISINVGWRL